MAVTAALYAVKSLLDDGIQFTKRIRFYFWTDEETCMLYDPPQPNHVEILICTDSSFPQPMLKKAYYK